MNLSGTDHVIFLSSLTGCAMADEWYEMATEGHFWMKWRHEVFKRNVDPRHLAGPVLEVGCGAGVNRKMLEDEFGCSIDGCDLNIKALEGGRLSHGKTYYYDIFDRNKDLANKFSAVVLMDVLEHVDDPGIFLEAIRFHLKDGGAVLINVPAVQASFSRYDKVAGHKGRYDKRRLERELKEAGYSVDWVKYWGMTLVPFLFLRKIVVHFCSDQTVISRGFQLDGKITNGFFDFLRIMEVSLFPKVPIGSSLLAVARKTGESL